MIYLNFWYGLQKILKFRLKKIYIINTNSVTAAITNLFIKVIPEKLSERVGTYSFVRYSYLFVYLR